MKKKIWIINIIAFIGFLLAFRPQVTGYAFHEWLGLAVGFALILHLLQHWRWVSSICRTLSCAKTRLVARFILDGLMGLGLITIIVSGLFMSSILNLELAHYETWRIVHFSGSYITLVMLVIKIVLHWRLINNMITKAFRRTNKQRNMIPEKVSRRKFLKDACFVSVGLLGMVVVGAGLKGLLNNVTGASASVEELTTNQVEQMATAEPTATSEVTQANLPNSVATNQPAATYTLEPAATPTTIVQTGRALCNRHCAYPGRCRLYVDNNNNRLCDRGEYIW